MMQFFRLFPLFSIIFGLVSVVLCSILPAKRGRAVSFITDVLCSVLAIGVLFYALKNGNTVFAMGHLSHAQDGSALYWYNNVIRFGVTEAILAALFPIILLCCVLGGTRKLREDVSAEKEKYFYVLSSLALVALSALIYADDSFTGYVFLEISTLVSIGLVAIKDKGRTTVAAIRYMIFNLVGSGLYLIGIVLLYDLTGYFMFEKIHDALLVLTEAGSANPVITLSLALITVGLGIKSGLFPFCFWMADTYGESTTASAGIISGLISKGYIVLLLKYYLRAFGFSDGADGVSVVGMSGICKVVFLLGVGGMIFGSVSAIFEKRINKMIAYSSAAQIGYVYLAIGLGECAMPGALIQIVAHAITKPLLFLSARGLIEVSDHRQQFYYLRGSGKRNAPAALFFSFGALSMVGFPATAGFSVKYLFLESSLLGGVPRFALYMTVCALVVSTLLNTVYFIHTVITIYSPAPEESVLPDVSGHKNCVGWLISCSLLVVLNLGFGLSPTLIDTLCRYITLGV